MHIVSHMAHVQVIFASQLQGKLFDYKSILSHSPRSYLLLQQLWSNISLLGGKMFFFPTLMSVKGRGFS